MTRILGEIKTSRSRDDYLVQFAKEIENTGRQRKVEREIAAFRRYQELSGTLIDTNEDICRSRPVEDTLSLQEKKRRKRSGRKSNAK